MRFYKNKKTGISFIYIPFESSYVSIENSKTYFFSEEEVEEISFHEAFRNDVNKIVLEAVTSQNRDSIWNHNNKECLAVSDLQKDWILKNYVLKGENVYAESYVKGIEKNLTELTQKSIDDQRVNDQRFCELYDSKKAISDKFQEATAYIGELKKFIQHLQDYIAAKHLEENGLILEKFIQEENTNASKKESN